MSETSQPQHNKALHPTASVPLVPRSASAAGELSRSAAAHTFQIAQQTNCKIRSTVEFDRPRSKVIEFEIMPELKWDETDFMECLEVIPEIEDYETEHFYNVKQDALILNVTVWQYESVVSLCLHQQKADAPLIDFVLFVREDIQYIKDKRGEYLEFRNCIVAPSRFSYSEMGDIFDKTKFNRGLTVQLAIKPHIQIRHIRD